MAAGVDMGGMAGEGGAGRATGAYTCACYKSDFNIMCERGVSFLFGLSY